MLTPADVLPRLRAVCLDGAKHPDYDLTVARAGLYRRLATGSGIEDLMRQYASQETDEQYASRVRMMITTVPAWWDQARKKFYEVARLRGGTIVKRLDYPATVPVSDVDRLRTRLTQAVDHYYQQQPLESYIAERLTKSHCMSDPNAWHLTDFDPFDYRTQVAQPYPVLIPCEAAVDFQRQAGVTSYFTASFRIPQSQSQFRYVCWLPLVAVDCWPVVYEGTVGVPTLPEGSAVFFEMRERLSSDLDQPTGKVLYQCRLLQHNARRVPAKAVGYVVDEEGSGESFVSPLHAGVCFLKQSLKVGSENDIVMSQMSSPIRAAYGEDCPGEIDPAGGHYACVNGVNPQLLARCGACGGTGKKTTISTTAAKTITVPYPKPGEDIPVKPGDAMAFIGPNVENPKFQVEYLDRAGKLFLQTIFGNYDGQRTTGGKTATEDVLDRQSELTALAPFADWFSGDYVHQASVCADYVDAGEPQVTYEFPADLERVSLADLFAQRSAAVLAGADSNVLEALDAQIATKQYATDPDGLLKNQVKRRFMTFLGMTNAEVNALYLMGGCSKENWLLRTSADIIFGELEIAEPRFYQLNYAAQLDLVNQKVTDLLGKLPAQSQGSGTFQRMQLSAPAVPAVA